MVGLFLPPCQKLHCSETNAVAMLFIIGLEQSFSGKPNGLQWILKHRIV